MSRQNRGEKHPQEVFQLGQQAEELVTFIKRYSKLYFQFANSNIFLFLRPGSTKYLLKTLSNPTLIQINAILGKILTLLGFSTLNLLLVES